MSMKAAVREYMVLQLSGWDFILVGWWACESTLDVFHLSRCDSDPICDSDKSW